MGKLTLALVLAALVGCASNDGGEADPLAAYPPDVQQKLRDGVIEVGYTPEMVRLALGKPQDVQEVTSEDGVTEIWTYRESRPGIGIGIGSGRTTGNFGIGTGISMGRPASVEDRAVVEFRGGRVTSFRTPAPQ